MRYFNLFFSRCVKVLHLLPLLALKVKQYCIWAIKLFCTVHPHCPDKAWDILVWSGKLTLVGRMACRRQKKEILENSPGKCSADDSLENNSNIPSSPPCNSALIGTLNFLLLPRNKWLNRGFSKRCSNSRKNSTLKYSNFSECSAILPAQNGKQHIHVIGFMRAQQRRKRIAKQQIKCSSTI